MIMYFIETINVYTIVESGRIRSVTVIRLSGTGRIPGHCSEANSLPAANLYDRISSRRDILLRWYEKPFVLKAS